jgi:hypothetical protein
MDRDGERDEDRATDREGDTKRDRDIFHGVSDLGAQLLNFNISANLKSN